MDFDKNIFRSNEDNEDYLKMALGITGFFDERRVETENGLYWSLEDAKTYKDIYYDEICFYAGSSGIAHYLLELYDITSDEKYLSDAKEAARYMDYRYHYSNELGKNFSKWAFSTGYAGVCFYLIELYEYTKDEKYRKLIEEITEDMIKDAKTEDGSEGYYWSSYPGIVGDAGTILYLLHAAKKLDKKEWSDFAVKAGRYFLNKGRNYEGTTYYLGVNPEYFGWGEDYIDPNFPMGAGGIGYLFLNLYEVSKDEIFLKEAEKIPVFMKKIAYETEDAALLAHALPIRKDIFYLGYCHGPAGTSRFFYKLYEITKKQEYRDYELKLARGIIKSGAPENHSPGYWHTYNWCCGTAGILNLFLGIWSATGDEEFLEYARRCGKHLMGFAFTDRVAQKISVRWHFALDRVAPQKVTSPIGLYDGCAGIGAALLQLYLANKGEFKAVRAIDDPYPER